MNTIPQTRITVLALVAIVFTLGLGSAASASVRGQVSGDWMTRILCGRLGFCPTQEGSRTITPTTNIDSSMQTNSCGNGICEDVVCMGIGCPTAENAMTCPQDCGGALPPVTSGQSSSATSDGATMPRYPEPEPDICTNTFCGDETCDSNETADRNAISEGMTLCNRDCGGETGDVGCPTDFSCLVDGSTDAPSSPYRVAWECGNMPNSPYSAKYEGVCKREGKIGRCVQCVSQSSSSKSGAQACDGGYACVIDNSYIYTPGSPYNIAWECGNVPGKKFYYERNGQTCGPENAGSCLRCTEDAPMDGDNSSVSQCMPVECAPPRPGFRYDKTEYDRNGCLLNCGRMVPDGEGNELESTLR